MTKQSFLKLHRWIGLGLALLLFVQGATGVTMVFRDEIERVIHPALIVAPLPARVSVQALLDTVRAAHPGVSVSRAEFPRQPDQAVLFKLNPKGGGAQILTAIDPYRNRIVRDGTPRSAWPVEWLFNVHEQLLAGPVGETIVGLEGIGLLFMAITGPIVWWPGRRRLRQGLRVKLDGSADLRWRTLHRAVGAIAAAFLILSATTGVLMVWKDTLRTAIGAPGKPNPKVAEQKGRAQLPVDDLIARAQARFGNAPLRQVRFSSGGRVVAVYLDRTRTIRPDGTTQGYYDVYDGEEIGDYVAGEMPASSEFVDWIYTVHTGLWGGLVTRILLLMTGLVLVGLAASGPWLWYSRTSRRRKNRSRK